MSPISFCSGHRQVITDSNMLYLRQLQELLFQNAYLVIQCIGALDDQHLVFFKSQFPVHDKLHLAVNYKCADDEDNRSGELEHHEGASQIAIFSAPAYLAL